MKLDAFQNRMSSFKVQLGLHVTIKSLLSISIFFQQCFGNVEFCAKEIMRNYGKKGYHIAYVSRPTGYSYA